jgi:hypothetical protein
MHCFKACQWPTVARAGSLAVGATAMALSPDFHGRIRHVAYLAYDLADEDRVITAVVKQTPPTSAVTRFLLGPTEALTSHREPTVNVSVNENPANY